MKGLYSGRVILARKAAKGSLTRTQTAAQAHASIIKKYGSISDTAKYMHKGSGNWVKYSIENDRKRTGKVTTDIKKWRAAPHKLDYKGIDTKEAGKTPIKSLKTSVTEKPRKTVKRKVVERRVDTIPCEKVMSKLTPTAKGMFTRELERTGNTFTATDSINGKKMKLSCGKVLAGMYDWEQLAIQAAKYLKTEKPKISLSAGRIKNVGKLSGRTKKSNLHRLSTPVQVS